MQEVTRIGHNEGTLCTKREGEGTPKTTLPHPTPSVESLRVVWEEIATGHHGSISLPRE